MITINKTSSRKQNTECHDMMHDVTNNNPRLASLKISQWTQNKEDTFEFEGKPILFNGMEYMNILNNFLNNEHLVFNELIDFHELTTATFNA